MIRHVVMWKLNGASSQERTAQAARLKAALESLHGKIEGMRNLEVGVSVVGQDEQNAGLVLITTHESWDALKVYQDHPDHLVVAKLVGELRSERRAVDFEVR
jgi:hypothetical protein